MALGIGAAMLGAAGIGAVSSAFGASKQQSSSQSMAREQMDFQKAANAKQMAFQERMSGSAHQRQVADLQAAGLNPILSANSGASSPGGATSAGAMGKAENILGAGAQGGLNALNTFATAKNLQANTANTVAKTAPTLGRAEAEVDAAIRIWERLNPGKKVTSEMLQKLQEQFLPSFSAKAAEKSSKSLAEASGYHPLPKGAMKYGKFGIPDDKLDKGHRRNPSMSGHIRRNFDRKPKYTGKWKDNPFIWSTDPAKNRRNN